MSFLYRIDPHPGMKEVYIVRHGKSDWNDLDLNDIDRPLKKRGAKNSHELGQHLRKLNWTPDIILSSPAVRAYDTAKILADELNITGARFKVIAKLYLPDFPTLLREILYLNDDLDSVMIIGHEPSLSNLINHFLHEPLDQVVTASLTLLKFDTDKWRDLTPETFIEGVHKNRHNMKGQELH